MSRRLLPALLLVLLPLLAWAGISRFDAERGISAKELKGYTRVAIAALEDGVEEKLEDAEKEAEHRKAIAEAGERFAELLVKRLSESGKFEVVARAPAEGATLLVGGRITRITRGNAAARYTGVFGRSRFAAVVEFKDAASGERIGRIEIDLASTPIPGATNIIQTVTGFMDGSAIRVRDELLIARGDLHREQTGRSGRLREKYQD